MVRAFLITGPEKGEAPGQVPKSAMLPRHFIWSFSRFVQTAVVFCAKASSYFQCPHVVPCDVKTASRPCTWAPAHTLLHSTAHAPEKCTKVRKGLAMILFVDITHFLHQCEYVTHIRLFIYIFIYFFLSFHALCKVQFQFLSHPTWAFFMYVAMYVMLIRTHLTYTSFKAQHALNRLVTLSVNLQMFWATVFIFTI